MQDILNSRENYCDEVSFRPMRTKRKTLLFVSPTDIMTDCIVHAIEREFPSLSIEHVQDLPAACREFQHPIALILIDAAMFRQIDSHADRIAAYHPTASTALLLRDNRHAPAVLDVFSSRTLRGIVPMDLRLDLWLAVIRLMLGGGEYIPASLLQVQAMAGAAAAPRVSAAPAESAEAKQAVTRSDDELFQRLTEREFQILSLVAQGHQNKIIAVRLGVSECTVKIHLHRVISKLGTHNRTQAAALFHQRAQMQAKDKGAPANGQAA